ncbi:hypothetical protein D3C76_1690840 [compost metagenome]
MRQRQAYQQLWPVRGRKELLLKIRCSAEGGDKSRYCSAERYCAMLQNPAQGPPVGAHEFTSAMLMLRQSLR